MAVRSQMDLLSDRMEIAAEELEFLLKAGKYEAFLTLFHKCAKDVAETPGIDEAIRLQILHNINKTLGEVLESVKEANNIMEGKIEVN